MMRAPRRVHYRRSPRRYSGRVDIGGFGSKTMLEVTAHERLYCVPYLSPQYAFYSCLIDPLQYLHRPLLHPERQRIATNHSVLSGYDLAWFLFLWEYFQLVAYYLLNTPEFKWKDLSA